MAQSYIVVLKEGYEDQEYEKHEEWVADQMAELRKRDSDWSENTDDELQFVNISSFKAYAGHIPPELVSAVGASPMVECIEPDSPVRASTIDTQVDAPWGLVRVSHRNMSGPANKYIYDPEGGKGVTAYVIDSGIKTTHPDFEGRAVGANFSGLDPGDDHGHGSHVAGTIGGKTYGIAKKVDLVSLRVLDSAAHGNVSDTIKALAYAVREHLRKVEGGEKGYRGAVVNLSLGGESTYALDWAVNAAVRAGLQVVVAAGNDDDDACDVSPARAWGPITVGATDETDQIAAFSNWGSCVDILAPGSLIRSVGIKWASQTGSGTSMAAPHVTGLLCYFLSLQPDRGAAYGRILVSPSELKRRFLRFGSRGFIGGLDDDTPNILAYNGAKDDLANFWA